MFGRNTPIHLRLLARAWPYRGLLLLTLAATAATTAMQVATPQLLRFAVDTGFDITIVRDEGDNIVEQDGVRFYMDRKSTIYLKGIQLDFKEGLQGKGFVFQNPNATHTCGCGESFSV